MRYAKIRAPHALYTDNARIEALAQLEELVRVAELNSGCRVLIDGLPRRSAAPR
jgi:hypothetical protein